MKRHNFSILEKPDGIGDPHRELHFAQRRQSLHSFLLFEESITSDNLTKMSALICEELGNFKFHIVTMSRNAEIRITIIMT